jgi:hypothetical protein
MSAKIGNSLSVSICQANKQRFDDFRLPANKTLILALLGGSTAESFLNLSNVYYCQNIPL